ncbi:hypothetical protein BFP78_15430 [Gaetbulibacter sp. 5U11]|nr:hypothetical protein BFP78_15430 [Gaetbulibacter sp. 5U11]
MFNFFRKSKSKKNHYLPKRMWNKDDLTWKEIEKYHLSEQISGADFINLMNNEFTSYVKSLGFRGSKNNFYKKSIPWIYTIHIHKDKWGGSCALNIGVHVFGIEDGSGILPKIPSKYNFYDCIIHKNISMDNDNGWFYYGQTIEEGKETVRLMLKMFKDKAIPFFNLFQNYPHPFDKITVDDIKNKSDNFIQYGIGNHKPAEGEPRIGSPHFSIFLANLNFELNNLKLAEEILDNLEDDIRNSENYIKTGKSHWLETIEKMKKKYRQQRI